MDERSAGAGSRLVSSPLSIRAEYTTTPTSRATHGCDSDKSVDESCGNTIRKTREGVVGVTGAGSGVKTASCC